MMDGKEDEKLGEKGKRVSTGKGFIRKNRVYELKKGNKKASVWADAFVR